MAVVLLKSSIASGAADPLRARGSRQISADTLTNAATDSIGSKYLLMNLPSEAVLLPSTQFKVDTWGYVDIRIGTFTDPAALVSQLRSVSANVSPLALWDAKWNKPLWQQLGLAADPGGEIGIYAHGSVAAAAGAGTMNFSLEWQFRY